MDLMSVVGKIDMKAINQIINILDEADQRKAKGILMEFLSSWIKIENDINEIKGMLKK